MNKVPKPTGGDVVYAAVKGGLSLLPATAPVVELLSLIIASPLQRRTEKWMTEVGEALQKLQDENRVNLNELQDNEQFVDIVLKTTTLALKTSDAEKLRAFKNAILNTALEEGPDKILSEIFLNYLDTFTVWHIKLLVFAQHPEQWFEQHGEVPKNVQLSTIKIQLTKAYPEWAEHGSVLELMWTDLKNAGFQNSGDLRTSTSLSGILTPKATPLGIDFLRFIQKHD